jgi:hypothetical protein
MVTSLTYFEKTPVLNNFSSEWMGNTTLLPLLAIRKLWGEEVEITVYPGLEGLTAMMLCQL